MDNKLSGLVTLQLVGIGISIVTLLLVVSIFNRTGEDLGDVAQRETQETAEATKLAAARVAASTRLVALKAQIAAGMAADEAAEEMQEIRQELGEAYQGASAAAQEDLAELDRDFDALEQDIRNGTANMLDSLENLISRLKTDVRYDE